MVEISPAHEILRRWWKAEGADIRTRCVAELEIESLEQRYGITLPRSFRDYLSNASPADSSWDKDFTIWWPLADLKTVAEGYENPLDDPVAAYRNKLILFADYCIWCWAWAINCAPGADYGKVAVIGGNDRFVADSFDQFVATYVGGSRSQITLFA